MTKKLKYCYLPIVLMMLLLIQSQGAWLIFKVQQFWIKSEIKAEIKSGIPDRDLIKLAIAKVWEEESNARFEREHAKEFRFDNNWYDVVKSQTEADTTYYWCILDDEETALFAALESLTQEMLFENEEEEERRQLIDWFIQKYVSNHAKLFLNKQAENQISINFQRAKINCSIEIPSPPPEVLIG